MSLRTLVVAAGLCVCALSGLACAGASDRAITQTVGPDPQLPQPNTSLVPTIDVVNAVRWREGQTPVAHNGASVAAFATGLDHPRWLYVLPNGDVLVAETNAPERPDANSGVRGWFMAHYQEKAGGVVPSADRITLLRDENGDGVVDTRTAFLTNLHSPFGMALVGDTLYVANTNALVKFPYSTGATSINASRRRCWNCPPARGIATGPKTSSPVRTARSCISPSDQTVTLPKTGWRQKKAARRSGSSISRPGATARLRPGCAIRSAWRGNR